MAAAPRVTVSTATDAAVWDAIVATSPGATAFHDWSWLDLQQDLLAVRIDRLLVLADDEPVGVFPVPRRSARSLDTLTLPFPFVGPLLPPDLIVPALRAFRAWQRSTGLLLGRFDVGAALADAFRGPLREAGCTSRDDTTVVVDVRHGSAETVLANCNQMRRKSLRRAERAGSSVRESLPGEIADLLPRVLAEAYGTRETGSPYPDDIGARIEAWAVGRDVRMATALVGDEPAGALVSLGGHPTTLAWAGACFRRFRDSDPNALLYLDMLQWSATTGHLAADLCGAVDEGILRFKSSYGGEARPYLAVESFLAPGVLRSAPKRIKALLGR